MVTFIDEWRRKFPSCMVVKRLNTILLATLSDNHQHNTRNKILIFLHQNVKQIFDKNCFSMIYHYLLIEKAIRKTKNGKVTGIDGLGLPLKPISSNSLALAPILEYLFNSIFESCSNTDRWVDGVKTLIFKSGFKTAPESYRNVTVQLHALSLLFEIVLENR